MKALLPAAVPRAIFEEGPLWVVFEVTHVGPKIRLTELARVRAGGEVAAIVSVVELGFDKKEGHRVAIRCDDLRLRRTRVHFLALATIE